MNPIVFAIAAAVSFGVWTIFHRLAAPHVNQTLGAVIVSATAVVAGGVAFWLLNQGSSPYITNWKGWLFLLLAGVSAFLIDYFVLRTYASGLPVTVGGPIIIGGSIAVATIIGFFIGDSITAIKLLGILLLAAGAVILSIYQ